ncbi:transcriptional adapter 1-like [Anopheles ziemanni]|uniref:transcriptional adapter 1-like n=1 Tax=Anopheles ziemanni TaxID=345580 RepID=UPI00265B16B7|nr:transcriptional adapter 1-like isoform X2 [Anopheles coustani]XP_058172455.1 transcriptional adapter 1-like [Anopheles ziemanni]
MSASGESNEVQMAKQALMQTLGDKWAMYLTNMKLWFRKKHSREEFDIECRKLFSPDQLHLHNRFLLAILNKIDAVAPPQSSNDGRSAKKRKRSSKSSSDRATFELVSLHEYISREIGPDPEPASSQGTMAGIGSSVSTMRYAAQELFLPDNGLVLGRLLVGAWEHGLSSADDAAVEMIVNSVQVLLKNILSAIITSRKHYRITANGTFYYDVGCELKHPFVRNTITKAKIDDEPMDLDKEITTVCHQKPPPGESTFLASCGQLYPTISRKINAFELYKALQDRNLISSHSVYSMNIERISSQLS